MDYDGVPDVSAPVSSKFEPLPPEELDTEFKRKYPPDAIGKEMEDGARVWKVYRDEATAHDKAMLEGWNNTLNILLIFAGLFSAVATAFVVESYRLLQPNTDEYMVSVLYALLVATNNSAAMNLAPPPPNSAPLSPSQTPRWVNGLWFTSLLLSLAVALLSILVKQWLDEYAACTMASAKNLRDWARRRIFYFEGIRTWHVSAFVSVLPLLLHMALFLFFGGLVLLLWDLDRGISVWLLVVSGILLAFYVATILVPLIRGRGLPVCNTTSVGAAEA